MTSGSRRGRRDNGLDASSFVPLRDVDPRVGEHLLDLLREAGIAAYLEPTSDVDSYTRAVSLPSPPSDRLWVDRAARPDAHSLIVEHSDDDPPDPPQPVTGRSGRGDASDVRGLDEKTIWAQIVADYDRASDAPVPPWPVHEDTDHVTERDEPRTEPEPTGSDGPRTRRERAADPRAGNPDDHYLPPPPPPVPHLQRATLYALALIAAGAMFLVAPGALDLGADVSLILGVVGIVAGVGMLVYRMRERPVPGEDPDDGAVV
ncbi:MAG: hypothetical protein H0V64_15770 [Geodermatophilaceae bacterium]|nr:hypothetical protein [Geodermatophilaceae bacterium]MDQ3464760.1 hypothetical protein [Actinomycetota bacterium]